MLSLVFLIVLQSSGRVLAQFDALLLSCVCALVEVTERFQVALRLSHAHSRFTCAYTRLPELLGTGNDLLYGLVQGGGV